MMGREEGREGGRERGGGTLEVECVEGGEAGGAGEEVNLLLEGEEAREGGTFGGGGREKEMGSLLETDTWTSSSRGGGRGGGKEGGEAAVVPVECLLGDAQEGVVEAFGGADLGLGGLARGSIRREVCGDAF